MATVSNVHLFFLVLAAVPFSFSGYMVRSSGGTPAATFVNLLDSASISAPVSTVTLVARNATTTPKPTLSQSLASSSVVNAVTSLSTPPTQSQNQSLDKAPDLGHSYGNVVIRNNCNDTKYLMSIGAWLLHGYRNGSDGWSVQDEYTSHFMIPGTNHSEPYRTTCPPALNGTIEYCWDHDKLRGQGVAIKISASSKFEKDILQLEYALLKNTMRNDTFYRLEYDVSLLDCADQCINLNFMGSTRLIETIATSLIRMRHRKIIAQSSRNTRAMNLVWLYRLLQILMGRIVNQLDVMAVYYVLICTISIGRGLASQVRSARPNIRET